MLFIRAVRCTKKNHRLPIQALCELRVFEPRRRRGRAVMPHCRWIVLHKLMMHECETRSTHRPKDEDESAALSSRDSETLIIARFPPADRVHAFPFPSVSLFSFLFFSSADLGPFFLSFVSVSREFFIFFLFCQARQQDGFLETF